MNYNQITISDAIKFIASNEYYLPAIQRKFVWKERDIYKLFDSLMQGFPIGTFLFWRVEKEQMNKSVFYKFISDFHEIDTHENIRAPAPETREYITGILDGQQRLTSLFIALQGSFACYKKGARKNNSNSYIKKELYLNLKSQHDTMEDGDIKYLFKFLTNEEANENNLIWLKAKDVLTWSYNPDIDAIFDDLAAKTEIDNTYRPTIKRNMRRLHEMVAKDKSINFFSIDDTFENALDIFVRVNSTGQKLTKSDLLYSTIIATWEKARENAEDLQKELAQRGFNFDKDFILRACIFNCDISIKYTVDAFDKANILKIKDNWRDIKQSIIQLITTLSEIGFTNESVTSQNALIPVSYYIFKGGKLTDLCKKEIRKFLLATLIKGTFGGHTDAALTQIKNAIQTEGKLIDIQFSYSAISERMPEIKVKSEDIENVLNFEKGSRTLAILTLLYPDFKYSQVQFHQDHLFSKSKNTGNENANKLPNLQLLEGKENRIKYHKTFESWVDATFPAEEDKQQYLRSALIYDLDPSKINDFNYIYSKRKEKIRERFKKEFFAENTDLQNA